jgi:hypothetical protein
MLRCLSVSPRANVEKMIVEYTLGSKQRHKYIILPVMKLSGVIVVATIAGIAWLHIEREQVLLVIALTWAWVFFLHLLPLLILGIRHTHLSKDSYFAIDTVNDTYQYNEKGISLSFSLTDIDEVVKVVSPPKYDKRVDILGFGHFYYWQFKLVDGRVLSISCLVFDVEDFSRKGITQEKRLFPVPPSNLGLRS